MVGGVMVTTMMIPVILIMKTERTSVIQSGNDTDNDGDNCGCRIIMTVEIIMVGSGNDDDKITALNINEGDKKEEKHFISRMVE